jgi:hypothetical protein
MLEEVGFRVASWDTPLRVNPNRHAGRWNHADSGATQYIALHPLGTWAEYLRWHDLRERSQLHAIRLGVWALRVDLEDAVDIHFENAEAAGLPSPEALVSDDWSACQALADRLRSDRAAPKALIVPSAALPGARTLVILEPCVAVPYTFQPLDRTDIPVTLAAAGARPPASILELVRFSGEKHAELEAWRRGAAFELVEPSDALLADDARAASEAEPPTGG